MGLKIVEADSTDPFLGMSTGRPGDRFGDKGDLSWGAKGGMFSCSESIASLFRFLGV